MAQRQGLNDIAEALRRLHAKFASLFDTSESQLILEFLDHGELGLAYAQLCDALATSAAPIASETFNTIRGVGMQMRMKPETWERLGSDPLRRR